MPVEAGDLDLEGILDAQPPTQVEHEQRQQPEYAEGDVAAVEAGEHEKRRAEEVGLQRQPFVHERRELVRLEAEEDEAEQRGAAEPEPRLEPVAALHRGQGQHHQE